VSGQFSYLGSRSLGQCVPLALQAQLGIDASVGIVLPQITAQIEGAIELQANLTLNPPTLAANLQAALGLVAALEASIAIGAPSVSFQLAAVAELLAKLQADLGALNAQLAFSANLGLVLGVGGVLGYAYSGSADGISDAAQNAFSGGLPTGGDQGAEVHGAFFIASTPAAREAMALLFG
jgi:hypothetical protein